MNRKTIANLLLKVLGVVLAITLLAWTIRRTESNPLDAMVHGDKRLLLVALGCIGLTHVLGAWRWGRLLAVQGITLPFGLLLKLTLAGIFFSQLIPGAVSGDILKLAYVAKNHKGRGAETFMTLAVDRVVGVAGLFCAASLSGAVFWLAHGDAVAERTVLQMALAVVFCGGVCSLLGLWVLVCHQWFLSWPWISAFVGWLGRHLPGALTAMVQKLCQAAALYRHAKRTLLWTLVISMVIHSSLGTGLFCIGRAIGETALDYGTYFLSTQIGNAVTLVPVTPGGLGIRDSVSAALLNAVSAVPPAMTGAIPVINSILGVVWGMVGAICLGFLGKCDNGEKKNR